MFHYLEIFRGENPISAVELEQLCKEIDANSELLATGPNRMVMIKFVTSPTVSEISRMLPEAEIQELTSDIPVTLIKL